MSYFKLSLCIAVALSGSALADNQTPTKTEIDALQSTHSQFENLLLDGESAYQKSKKYIDSISTNPNPTSTSVKYPGTASFTKEDARLFRESVKQAQELGLEESNKKEWLKSTSTWDDMVNTIAVDTKTAVEKRIAMAYPQTQGGKVEVVRGNDADNSYLNGNEDLYLFITSSMNSSKISEILVAAKMTGGTVVLRGMIPNSNVLTDTSRYLLKILKIAKLDKDPPKVVIDPRLFNTFGIKYAPAMAYMNGSVEVVAHGVVSIDWFIEKARSKGTYTNLGMIGPTIDIVEEDILALLERKYKAIDWDKQRKKALSSFFAKQTFKQFPVSDEDKYYELDPRIIFTTDVYAGDRLMAKKGDVVNPLEGFEGVKRSLFIIDPRDPRQRSLVKENLYKDSVGNPAILVSHLDASKQFDGINDLETEFDHKIYMLQNTYIDRFRITVLPIKVDVIGGKGIWIKEYGTETLNTIHEKYKESNK